MGLVALLRVFVGFIGNSTLYPASFFGCTHVWNFEGLTARIPPHSLEAALIGQQNSKVVKEFL